MGAMLRPEDIDAIQWLYQPERGWFRVIPPSPEADNLTSMLFAFSPTHLHYTSNAVRTRTGHSNEMGGFRYPVEDMLDPGEALWEGVEVYCLDDVSYVSEPDFDRLMMRLFRAFIETAPSVNHKIVGTPVWDQLLDNVAAIEAQGRGR